jgi:hypothetical protein
LGFLLDDFQKEMAEGFSGLVSGLVSGVLGDGVEGLEAFEGLSDQGGVFPEGCFAGRFGVERSCTKGSDFEMVLGISDEFEADLSVPKQAPVCREQHGVGIEIGGRGELVELVGPEDRMGF